MSAQHFLTIAGRWRQHVEASGIDKALPRREQGLAMLMFYAGFSAALDAGLEVAEFPEDEAMMPFARSSSVRERILLVAPRILKDPVSWRFSGLK